MSENEKVELLRYSLSRLDSIVVNADNKANFFLCFSVAIFSGIIAVYNVTSTICEKQMPFFLLAISFIILSIFGSLCVIFPRFKGRKFGESNDYKSVLFFEKLQKEIDYNYDYDVISKDLEIQILSLSKIINKKMNSVKFTVFCCTIGCIFGIAFLLMLI